jgi:hypothetical protein
MTDQPAPPIDELEPEDLLPEDVAGTPDPVVPYVEAEVEEYAREGTAAQGFFDLPGQHGVPTASNAPHLSND